MRIRISSQICDHIKTLKIFKYQTISRDKTKGLDINNGMHCMSLILTSCTVLKIEELS